MYEMLDVVTDIAGGKATLPDGRGHGGLPVEGVARGVDMFDCVLQTRIAQRTALVRNRSLIRNAEYARISAHRRGLRLLCVPQSYAGLYQHLIKTGEILYFAFHSQHEVYDPPDGGEIRGHIEAKRLANRRGFMEDFRI